MAPGSVNRTAIWSAPTNNDAESSQTVVSSPVRQLYTSFKTFIGSAPGNSPKGSFLLVFELQTPKNWVLARGQRCCFIHYLLHPAGRGSWACLWWVRCTPQGGRGMMTGCLPEWDWSLQSTPPHLHCQTPAWTTTQTNPITGIWKINKTLYRNKLVSFNTKYQR